MDELKQIEALKEFDKMNRKYNSYTILGYKVVGIIYGILSFFMVMIPIQEWGFEEIKINLWKIIDIRMQFILFMSVYIIYFMYYKYLQVISIEKQQVSIYKMLKEVPISPRVICRDRAKKLFLFGAKITIAFLVIQIFSSIIFLHEVTIWNVAIPLLDGVVAYGIIYLWMKAR